MSFRRKTCELNAALYAVGRRAVVGVGARYVTERLVVKEPTGVDDAVQQDVGRQLRQLTSYSVEVNQHACTASTANGHTDSISDGH